MKENDKKIKELTGKLNNKNTNSVIGTISGLRNREYFTGVIQLLVEMYNVSDNADIRNTIKEFMNDLKEPATRQEVIGELKKDYTSETLEMIASSCWQSGLDYSEYATDFADLFAREEYMVALECFTVLEEASYLLSRSTKDSIISTVRKGINNYSRDKSALMMELINMLG